MFKTLIIEDESPAARRLERLLQELDFEVVAKLQGVKESIKWFQSNPHPNLIFVDIQLSDGLSFEIFEKTEVKSALIFTTAYDQFTLKAFKLNSIDYLLKPIDKEELKQAVYKFKNLQNTPSEQIEAIKDLLLKQHNHKERFSIQIGQRIKILETKNIDIFYSQDKSTFAKLNSGKDYLLNESLDTISQSLDPFSFFRVSRKFIINITAIKDIISYANSRLKINLHSGFDEEIIVSREKVKEFKNWLTAQ